MAQDTRDRRRLFHFLNDVHDFLDHVVATEELFGQDIYREVYELWAHAKEQRLIAKVQDVLAGNVAGLAEPPTLDARLERAGLTGYMLDIKLRIFDRLLDRTVQNWASKPIRKVLGAINTILGSLTSAIPIAEPLLEVKDLIEQLIEEDEE